MTPEEVAALENAKKKLLESGELFSKSDVDERMADLLKQKKLRKEAEEERDRLKRENEDRNTKELTAKEQFKELADQRGKQIEEYEERDKKRSASLSNYLKMQALKDAALKMGLKPESVEDLKFIGLSDVQVEVKTTEDGQSDITVLNADKVAERIKQIRPHWFGGKKSPSLNTDDPGVVRDGQVTMKQVIEAGEKASKTGDSEDAEKYQKLNNAYRDQLRARK